MTTTLHPAPELAPTLSLLEADALRDVLGIESWPYPLAVPSHGVTMAERSVLRRGALETLAARGLVTDGEPDEELAADLRALARPDVAVDCAYHPGDDAPLVNGLVVRRGQRAVAAQLTPDGLHLHPCRPTALAHEVVGLLPPGSPGAGQGMTVALDVLDAAARAEAAEGSRAGAAVLVEQGVSAVDARTLQTVFGGRRRGGQIGVVRVGSGAADTRPVRSEELISWVDTDTGRYMTLRSPGPRPVLSLVPVDDARLLRRVAELVSGE